jgi:hypothetical protein
MAINYMQSSYEKGLSAENDFINVAKHNGYKVIKANDNQDKFEGWDFEISQLDERLKVEVKSAKPQHAKQYLVEIKGVSGYDGWINKQADVIAYQNDRGFTLIPRTALANISKDLPTTHRPDRPREAVCLVDRSLVDNISTLLVR